VTGRLPSHIGYWLAKWVGRLLYLFSPRLKRVLTHNMRHVLGPDANESQVQAVVRQALVNIAKGHHDLFRLARLSSDELERMVRIEGKEYFEQARALGRGTIGISAHLGNVDFFMQATVVRGIPTVAPVLRTEPERLFRYTRRLRESHGLRLIPSDEPMIGLMRALKQGNIVGLACDRDVGGSSRVIDFFGKPTRLPAGPVRVALKTGSPLLPAFALRLPDNTFVVEMEPPLTLPKTGDTDADIDNGMRKVVAIMERYIARHPEQWLVAAPIWPMD
jgi:KDO2-lipid IV(A) lauroyltransferase